MLAAIANARSEVLVQTFIWQEDRIGTEFAACLIAAASRGVSVQATVDGYGTPEFSKDFLSALQDSGVRIRVFDPQSTLFRIRTNFFCRLHQKIVVIDGSTGFVGGINICDDHLRDYGKGSKQDYALEVSGPVVSQIREYVYRHGQSRNGPWWRNWRYWLRLFPRELKDPGASAQVLFATRDNSQHPTDIETLYRIAIRNATREIVIANAYFFPGYRFVRDLLNARRRGVRVKLILQGNPDRPVSIGLASILYDDLASAGVEIYQYTERPLHAKVAVVDDNWATVGSSNLDPTSLGLNYEANLFVLDRAFNRNLHRKLSELIDYSCEKFSPRGYRASRLRTLLTGIVYHLTRRMTTWGRRAVRRKQRAQPPN